MAGMLPTTPLAPPFGGYAPMGRIAPNALPYMVKHRCFPYCLPTPEFELCNFPSPCICQGPPPTTFGCPPR